MKNTKKRELMFSLCFAAACMGGYGLASAAQVAGSISQNDNQTKEDKKGAAIQQEDIYAGLTKMEQAQLALSSQKQVYHPAATTAVQPPAEELSAELPKAAGEETGETAKQGSVQNETGFFVKQDVAAGHPEVYNSLTKDGLWVGGTDGQTGFRVSQAGDMITSGTGTFGNQLTVTRGGAIINGSTVIAAIDGDARTYQSVKTSGSRVMHSNDGVVSMLDVNDSGVALNYITRDGLNSLTLGEKGASLIHTNNEKESISGVIAKDDAVVMAYGIEEGQENSLIINEDGTVINGKATVNGDTSITSTDGRTILHMNAAGGGITTTNADNENIKTGVYIQDTRVGIQYKNNTNPNAIILNGVFTNQLGATLDYTVKDAGGKVTAQSQVIARANGAAMGWLNPERIALSEVVVDANGALVRAKGNYIKVNSVTGTSIQGYATVSGDTQITSSDQKTDLFIDDDGVNMTVLSEPDDSPRYSTLEMNGERAQLRYADQTAGLDNAVASNVDGAEMYSKGTHGTGSIAVNEETGAVTKYEVKDAQGAVSKTNSLTVDGKGIAGVGDTSITSSDGKTALSIWSRDGRNVGGFQVLSGTKKENLEKPEESTFTGGILSAKENMSWLGYEDDKAGIVTSVVTNVTGASLGYTDWEKGIANSVAANAAGVVLDFSGKAEDSKAVVSRVSATADGAELAWADPATSLKPALNSVTVNGRGTFIKGDLYGANEAFHLDGNNGNVRTYGEITVEDSATKKENVSLANGGSTINGVGLAAGKITAPGGAEITVEGTEGDTGKSGSVTVAADGVKLQYEAVKPADPVVTNSLEVNASGTAITGNVGVTGELGVSGKSTFGIIGSDQVVLADGKVMASKGLTTKSGGADITGDTAINNGTFKVNKKAEQGGETTELFSVDGSGNMTAAGNLSAAGGKFSMTNSGFSLGYTSGSDKTMTVNNSAVRFGVTGDDSAGAVSIDLNANNETFGKVRSVYGFAVGKSTDKDQTVYGKGQITYGSKTINLDSIATVDSNKGNVVQFDKKKDGTSTINQINGVVLDGGKVTANGGAAITGETTIVGKTTITSGDGLIVSDEKANTVILKKGSVFAMGDISGNKGTFTGELKAAGDKFNVDGIDGNVRTYGTITVQDNSNPRDIKANVTLANDKSIINGVELQNGKVTMSGEAAMAKGATITGNMVINNGSFSVYQVTGARSLLIKLFSVDGGGNIWASGGLTALAGNFNVSGGQFTLDYDPGNQNTMTVTRTGVSFGGTMSSGVASIDLSNNGQIRSSSGFVAGATGKYNHAIYGPDSITFVGNDETPAKTINLAGLANVDVKVDKGNIVQYDKGTTDRINGVRMDNVSIAITNGDRGDPVSLGIFDSTINGTTFNGDGGARRIIYDYSMMTPTGVAVGASQEYTLYGRDMITYKEIGKKDEISLKNLKAMEEEWKGNGNSFTPKTTTPASYSLRSGVSNTMVADENTSDDRPTPGQNADTNGSSVQNSAGNGFWAKDDGTNTIKGNTTFDNDLTVTGKTQLNGGLDVGGKAITGVGDGKVEKDSKEAINGSQLYTEQQARIDQDKVLGTQINDIGRSVNKLGGEIDSVGAISAALAGLHPIDYDASKSKYQVAAAMGSYDGSTAMALGGFYNVNEDVLLSFGVSSALKGERKTAGNIGATFRIGAGNSRAAATDFTAANLLNTVVELKQENAEQKQENAELKRNMADQQKQLDEMKAILAAMQKK